ncbi:MAG: colicin D domain-containing protein, partial [Reyranellaceae bacterium]
MAAFEKALRAHVDAATTAVRVGTYRGLPATHYVDRVTGLNVMVDATGKFWSAWKL